MLEDELDKILSQEYFDCMQQAQDLQSSQFLESYQQPENANPELIDFNKLALVTESEMDSLINMS
jgi:hypothetical protein